MESPERESMLRVRNALASLRVDKQCDEFALHRAVGAALSAHGIAFTAEARLAPRRRIDFLTADGVGIEVKRAYPPRKQLIRQLSGYAECAQVCALLLLSERSVSIPDAICGKPCLSSSLGRLWGVEL